MCVFSLLGSRLRALCRYLESWLLFVDLVKAFDVVPRDSEHTLPREETDTARAALDEKVGML